MQYKLTLSVSSYETDLVNQLFQLTSEEHKVYTLFKINFDEYNITPFNNMYAITIMLQ